MEYAITTKQFETWGSVPRRWHETQEHEGHQLSHTLAAINEMHLPAGWYCTGLACEAAQVRGCRLDTFPFSCAGRWVGRWVVLSEQRVASQGWRLNAPEAVAQTHRPAEALDLAGLSRRVTAQTKLGEA